MGETKKLWSINVGIIPTGSLLITATNIQTNASAGVRARHSDFIAHPGHYMELAIRAVLSGEGEEDARS